MNMLNNIVLMGRMTRDPELRRTNSGKAVISFTLAVDRNFGAKDGEKETDFIDCTVWGNTAEFVSKYFSKGRMTVVCGRLQIRSYTDKDGIKRRNPEVVADMVYFADSKKEATSNETQYSSPNGWTMPTGGVKPAVDVDSMQDYVVVDGDDDQLPF